MSKRIELGKETSPVADLKRAGEIVYQVLTDKNQGMGTRGSFSRELIANGFSPDNARQAASSVIGSFAIHRKPDQPPLDPRFDSLALRKQSVSHHSTDGQIVNTDIYFNRGFYTADEATNKYLLEEEARREEQETANAPRPKGEKEQRKKKKPKKDRSRNGPLEIEIFQPLAQETELPKATADVKFVPMGAVSNEAMSKSLSACLVKLKETDPSAIFVDLRGVWSYDSSIGANVYPQETVKLIFKNGIRPDQYIAFIRDTRRRLMEKAQDIENTALKVTGAIDAKIETVMSENAGKHLIVAVPVQKEIYGKVIQLLKSRRAGSESISFKTEDENQEYKPLAIDIGERWNMRRDTAFLEFVLNQFVQKETITDGILEPVLIPDIDAMRVALSDLLRGMYCFDKNLNEEESSISEEAIRCLVDRFENAEEIFSLITHQDVEAFDFKQSEQVIHESAQGIIVLKEERKKLGVKTDIPSKKKREGIPSIIRDLEKNIDGEKKLAAQAKKAQQSAIPKNRIAEAIKKRIPRVPPRRFSYKDDESYLEDAAAFKSFRFLTEYLQLPSKQAIIMSPGSSSTNTVFVRR